MYTVINSVRICGHKVQYHAVFTKGVMLRVVQYMLVIKPTVFIIQKTVQYVYSSVVQNATNLYLWTDSPKRDISQILIMPSH